MKTLRFKVFGFAAIALLLAATVVSCGDEDEEKNPPTPPTENPADSDETVGSGTVPNDSTDISEPDSVVESSAFVPELAKTYIGGEYGNTQYFSKYMPTAGTEVIISAVENKLTLTHNSPVWGLFTFNFLYVHIKYDRSYTFHGEGTVDMPNEHTGAVTTYEAAVEGIITDGRLEALFTVPSVMGGFQLIFNPSDFDEVLNNSSQGSR